MDKEKFIRFANEIPAIANEIEALMEKHEVKGCVFLTFGLSGYVHMSISDCDKTLVREAVGRDFEIVKREKL